MALIFTLTAFKSSVSAAIFEASNSYVWEQSNENCHTMTLEWFGSDIQTFSVQEENEMDSILSEYFTVREKTLSGITPFGTRNGGSSQNEDLQKAMQQRETGIVAFQENAGLRITDAEVTTLYGPDDIFINEDGTISIYLYEWTFFDYDDLDDDKETTDVSGYGTYHKITLAENEGQYIIISDEYNERDIFGVCTMNEITEAELSEMEYEPYDIDSEIRESMITTYGMYDAYNPDAAAAYADRYVYVGATSGDYNYEGYYNSAYANFNNVGGDCANYTSQCIAAGGMPQVPGSAYATNCWYYRSSSDRSATWTGASFLRDWMARNRGNLVTASDSTVYKGSPVFYDNAHATICVGKNSAGIPIINSHNADRYHVRWNYWGTGTTYTTVQLTNSNQTNIGFDTASLDNVTNTNATISTWVNNSGPITEIGYYLGSESTGITKIPMQTKTVEWTRFHLQYDIASTYGMLSPGESYTYYFYVISGGHEYHSPSNQFRTNGTGKISYDTMSISDVSETSATVGAWFDNSSAVTISSLGFLYGENFRDLDITNENSKVVVNTNVNWTRAHQLYNIASYVTLKTDTQYYVRFFAETAYGTYYSDYISFNLISVPKITNVCITDVSEAGYTVHCDVEAASGINRVQLPTWTNYNGQDDLADYSGNISGNHVSYRVNSSDHNGEKGLYYTHIYAFANNGTHICVPVTANLGPNTLVPVKTAEYNGSRYEVYIVDDAISERTVWTYAKTFAESVGGHLATITSQEEQDAINAMITTQVEGYWIGGTDEVSEGNWKWVTGEPFSYENWASNQPDNGFGMQNYLALWPSVGKWDDGLNDAETVDYGFIVEYDLHVHNHKQTGYKAATCTQNGVITFTCDCGDTYTSNIVAPGHTEVKDKAVAATCTTAGKTEGKHCSICNKVLVAQEQIKALGHIWKAENTANGIITSVCTTCGEKKEENDPNVQKPQFEDVKADAYYADAVQWAVENSITNGYGSESTFCPDIECTRGQVVTFLWRAAGSPEPVSLNNPFTDVANNTYYYKAVLWAVENGITAGYGSDTIFNPDGVCTRAQVATFMWRAAGKPGMTGLNNRFTDISSDTYYYDAVLWAVENGITNGYGSDTIFNPDGNCTRGQIVTFLYRGMN